MRLQVKVGRTFAKNAELCANLSSSSALALEDLKSTAADRLSFLSRFEQAQESVLQSANRLPAKASQILQAGRQSLKGSLDKNLANWFEYERSQAMDLADLRDSLR